MKDPCLPWELALHSGMPSHRNVSKSQFDPLSSACSHSQILCAASQGLRRRDTTPAFSMDSLPTNQGQPPTSPWLLPRHLHTGMGSQGSQATLLISFQGSSREKFTVSLSMNSSRIQDPNLTLSSAPGFCHFLMEPPASSSGSRWL